MPGIFGIVDPHKRLELRILMRRMQKIMLHEPWYVSKFYSTEIAGLGKVDLGITCSRNQPVLLRNGTIFGVLDGKVHKERSESPTWPSQDPTAEFLLHFLERAGKNGINKINGSFAGAFWNEAKNKLTLFNDRFGFIPLYYTQYGDVFVFASELKALLTLPFITGELDYRALADFFTFGYMLKDETYFSEIKRLPAASWLEFKDGTLNLQTYWRPQYKSQQNRSTLAYVQEFEELFQKAVTKTCGEYPRIGALLSSGLDSRGIAAVLDSQDRLDHTFTLTDENSLEAIYASQVSAKLKGEHHVITIQPGDFIKNVEDVAWRTDGLISVFHTPIIALKDALRQNVDLVFDGIQMLRGPYSYWETKIPRWLYSKKVNNLSLYSRIFNSPIINNIDFYNNLFTKEFLANLSGGLLNSLNQTDFLTHGRFTTVWDQLDYLSLVHRKSRFVSMGPQLLRHWVEVGMPFFDYEVMTFIFSLPLQLREQSKLLLRRALKRLAPELAEIPACPDLIPAKCYGFKRDIRRLGNYAIQSIQKLSSSNPKLPQTKSINFEHWLRQDTELQKFVLANLLDSSNILSNFFELRQVKKVVQDHFLGKANHTEMIGRLLTFSIWHRQFLSIKSVEKTHERTLVETH